MPFMLSVVLFSLTNYNLLKINRRAIEIEQDLVQYFKIKFNS